MASSIVKDPTPEGQAIPRLAAEAAARRAQPEQVQLASTQAPAPTGDEPLPPGTFRVNDETPNIPASKTPDTMDVVSRPSKYYGVPKDIAKVMEMTDSRNASLGKRLMGADLPKYAFQLGAGATEAASLGLVQPGVEPETTGELIIRGMGNLFGSSFVPLGPVVKGAAKLGYSKTAAGALANVVAAEIQTRGQAGAGRLMLDAAFGAVFGKLYNTDAHWSKVPIKAGAKLETSFERGTIERASEAASQPRGQLLLPDYTGGRVRPDFIGREPARPGPTEFPYVTESLSGERVLPPHAAPNKPFVARDDLRAPGMSPNAITGEGLFDELGIKSKADFKKVRGKAAQRVLNQLGLHPDADVRETSRMAKNFIEHTDPVDTAAMLEDIGKLKKGGEPPNYVVNLGLGEDPFEIPRSKFNTVTSSIALPKRIFADIERDTGGRIKGYTDVFVPGTEARQLARVQAGKIGKAVADEIGGLSGSKQEGLKAYLMAPDENGRTLTAHAFNLTNDEIEKVGRVRNHLKEVFERNFKDSTFDDFMQDTLPRMQHATPADREVLKFSSVAQEMENYAANHEFSIDERRLDRFSAGLIRSLSMKEHFDPFFKKAEALVADRNYPQRYRDYVADWARKTRGTDSAFSKDWTPRYQQFLRRLGMNADSADVRDLIDNTIQLTHSGLVGFRAAPVLKNLFNGWQTGAARIGPGWFFKGMAKAATREGFERARAAGMIEEAAHEVEALRELGAPGPITKGIRKITAAGLKLYGNVDDWNRSHVFNGMYERVKDAASRVQLTDEQFLSKAGLYRFHEVIQNEVLSALKQKGVHAAAEVAGVHAAQETQWVYRSEYRPTIMTGEKQRAFLQFGVWPANYLEYMRQMVNPNAIKNMPSVERAKWARDWAFTNGSLLALFGGAGAVLGIGKAATYNTLGWTGLGPLQYSGGVVLDFATALPKAVAGLQSGLVEQGAEQYLKSEPMRRIKSDLVSVVPGSGLARDIARAKGPLYQGIAKSPAGGLVTPFASQSIQPSQSPEEEMFRLMTGVGVKR